jgi:hypothetical protein
MATKRSSNPHLLVTHTHERPHSRKGKRAEEDSSHTHEYPYFQADGRAGRLRAIPTSVPTAARRGRGSIRMRW